MSRRRHLEEGELVAFEVGADEMAEPGERIEPARMQQLDEDVGVAIGLAIGAVGRVQRMRGIEWRGRVRRSSPQHLAHVAGPDVGIEPMFAQQGHVQRSMPEAEAGGMRVAAALPS